MERIGQLQKSNNCFLTFPPSLLLYLGSKRIHPLTYTLSFFMWACNSHVEKCISSAKQLSGTWQHHRNPSSVHLGCSWLFINTMQTVQCGCMWNRKKNKGPEQVNTSFIISFVWCVYCVLFLVHRSCLTVLQKGKKPFLELYLFALSL